MPTGRLARRFRSLLWKPGLDEEIAGELAFHLEMRAREYALRGLAPAAAAAAARRRFGDVGQVAAACRAIGRGRDRARERSRWLAETVLDLRLAGRRLGDRRVSSLLAVLSLGVGLAAAGTAWRVARAVLQPPPFAAPESLVLLRQASPQGVAFAATAPDYDDWRRQNRTLLGTAAFAAGEANLDFDSLEAAAAPVPPMPGAQGAPGMPPSGVATAPTEQVLVARATASLLPLLGVRPQLGRAFTAAEAARGGDHRVAVLSDALWRRAFAADPAAVGRTVRLDGRPVRIVGVMPAGFAMPAGAGLWMPLSPRGLLQGGPREHHLLTVIARLRPGTAPPVAAADLARVAAGASRRSPATHAGWGVSVAALPEAWAGSRWPQRARLLLAAAGLLWLLASASAANLLWARATARQREIDLRAALGGGRGRVVRQLLAESVLVALLGAAAGLLLAGAATPALRLAAADLPSLAALTGGAAPLPRLDLATAGLMLGLAMLSALLCGAGPALQALRPGPAQTVRQSARLTLRRERRLRDALVVAELAVATTLVVAAGLLLESYVRLDRANPGFEPDHVLSLRLALNGKRYPSAQRRALVHAVEARLARLPGVEAAGFTSTAPLPAEPPAEPFTLATLAALPTPRTAAAARPAGQGEFLAASWRVVTPGLFRTLGLRRVAGRLLDAGDRDARHPVAVVDAALARRYWPGAAALGQRLRWDATGRQLTVVGVVDGLRDLDLEGGPRPALLLSYDEVPWRSMALVVRPAAGLSRPAQADLAAAVRREVAALDPALPAGAVRFLEVARRQATAAPRFGLSLVALFAAAALALAVSGVYATSAAAVARRTAEIAVRQALGAAGGDVVRLILGRTAALAGLGVAVGTAGALAFSGLLGGLLYGTSAVQPAAYAAAAALLGGAALLACLVPARRATRIAPVLALRRE
jgi:putative ABC transport system permease protein